MISGGEDTNINFQIQHFKTRGFICSCIKGKYFLFSKMTQSTVQAMPISRVKLLVATNRIAKDQGCLTKVVRKMEPVAEDGTGYID